MLRLRIGMQRVWQLLPKRTGTGIWYRAGPEKVQKIKIAHAAVGNDERRQSGASSLG